MKLRGFNVLPVWSSSPGNTWGADTYTNMRLKGFNAVRMVVYWSDLEPARGQFNATHLATLDTAIARARAAGLYVVLNPVLLYNGETYVPSWARTGDVLADLRLNAGPYLRMIAGRYRSEPAVAAYDPVNEPPGSTTDQSAVLRLYAELIVHMRATAPDKIIAIEPTWGDSNMSDDDFGLLGTTRNIVLSYHDYYAGGAGDGYGANSAQEGTFTWNETTGYPVPNAGELEQHLLVQLRTAQAAGIPLWVGEMGINPAATNATQWIDEKVALYKKYGLGYTWWLHGIAGGMATMGSDYTFKPFVDHLR